MCGIAGLCGFGGGVDSQAVRGMTGLIRHRGPDDSGFYDDEHVALGHRRLSIVDLESGRQPIHNEDESVWIVYNGETYNHATLRGELESRGHRYYTDSDTETLVHAYEEWGIGFINRLDGMFGFALWDSNKKELYLARDGVGIKPLYYAEVGDALVFASEIKSILLYPGFRREVDGSALIDYLVYRYVPAPKTIYEGVMKLLPGHYMKVCPGGVEVSRYWDVDLSSKDASGDITGEIIKRLRDSVENRLMSDVPLGAFLSGGVDSSAIVGLMSQLMGEPVKTFSVGFGVGGGVDEVTYAKIVAEAFGTEHHELIVESNSLDLLPEIVWHFDEPLGDSAAVPTHILSEFARKRVKVVLTGEGADELFAGYGRYKAVMINRRFSRVYDLLPGMFKDNIMPGVVGFMPRSKARRFFERSLENMEDRYVDWISVFNREEMGELTGRELDEGAYSSSVYSQHFRNAGDSDLLKQMLYADSKVWLPDDLLMKVDKMTMANSLEARVPFLDHELLDYAFSVPSRMKLKGMVEKHVFKEAARDIVPSRICERKKHGFDVPLDNWFDEEFSRVSDYLLTEERGWMKIDYVKHILEHRRERNYRDQIWSLLSLELWARTFLDRENISKPLKRF
ncbi:MAG: asparagine synthase (glutamine-hydrolyzing) [Candidatus Altiarchaeales archaeon]|nr:asparagine synthase (glutamine-hydrolyzing) [Candidatus Altiarchaeales archaeon]MBD3417279.1 asparagine synthase (glutamine-hydrolyzing) [Candidatus Altiarchaeales archaeon]